MRDTIEMARKANLLFPCVDTVDGSIEQLKRFEALVRADEGEAWEQVCDQHLRHIAKLKKRHKAEILAEREACAKACESIELDGYPTIEQQQCAAAIRARGETK
jgi:hypothetical protein